MATRMIRTLGLALLIFQLGYGAESAGWPDLPDPLGLGPRLVTLEWLRDHGSKVPAGATDQDVLQAYADVLAGPKNQLRDETSDWDTANEADLIQRLRLRLKAAYNVDLPKDASRADAERRWKEAQAARKADDQVAIERLKLLDRNGRDGDMLNVAGAHFGIPDADADRLMDPYFTGKQRGSNWCWAACISMVCAFNRITYSQEDIVRDTKGALIDEGGSVIEMLTALSQTQLQPNGQPVQLVPQVVRSADDIVNDLIKRQPVILVLIPPNQRIGHAVVLTGIDVSPQREISFVVRDPSPYAPARSVLSGAEYDRLFVAGLRLRVVRF